MSIISAVIPSQRTLYNAANLDFSSWGPDPLSQLGLVEPEVRKLLLLAVTFRVYHAVELQHLAFPFRAHPFPGSLPSFLSFLHKLLVSHLKDVGFLRMPEWVQNVLRMVPERAILFK